MSENQKLQELLFAIASEIANKAKELAPVATSNLKNDIQVFDENISSLEIEVGNSSLAPYAKFVHEGTGLFGKYRRKIVPKNKKALKTPYGLKKSVKGQEANPYLKNAFEDLVNSNSLDRLIDNFAEDFTEDFINNLKNSLRNIEVN